MRTVANGIGRRRKATCSVGPAAFRPRRPTNGEMIDRGGPALAARACPTLLTLAVCWLLMLLTGVSQAVAQVSQSDTSPQSPGQATIDQQLLDELGPPSPASAPTGARAPRNTPAAGEDLGRPSQDNSPLAEIGRHMRRVERSLRERDTSHQTRQLQDRIAADLARVIEQIEQQQASSNKSRQRSRQSSGEQGTDASNAKPDGKASMRKGAKSHAAEDEVSRRAQQMWGVLPDRVLQQIQNAGGEEFLPQFKELIQQYYEKLAERGINKP